MCFSPQASFLAGITLTMIGLACMKKAYQAKRHDLLPLAAIPLLFGVQQFLEGALWLALLTTPRQETLYAIGLYGFLFFSLFWWPWWLPYSVTCCEHNSLKKRVLYLFTLAGLALGTYLIWQPLAAQLVNGHIAYFTSQASTPLFFAYVFISITPFFISSLRFAWVTGLLALFGLIATILIYFTWLTSVWCFFVALISTSIYALLRRIPAQ